MHLCIGSRHGSTTWNRLLELLQPGSGEFLVNGLDRDILYVPYFLWLPIPRKALVKVYYTIQEISQISVPHIWVVWYILGPGIVFI